MNEPVVPESRAYRHVQCGTETQVGGQSFEVVSNPMSSMERTQCSNCEAMFPITDFEWADTGEKISDYYARHTQSATERQRFLCSKKFMIAIVVVSIVLTEIAVYFIMSNSAASVIAFCMVGGFMIGGIIGMSVFTSVFADPIKRKVCGVKDTRSLT